MSRTACVDLCCGAGGLTLGFANEGTEVVAGVDSDFVNRSTYERNTTSRFVCERLERLSAQTLDGLFPPGSHRILAGAIPIKIFSNAADGKLALLRDVVRLADDVSPDVLALVFPANVKRYAVFRGAMQDLTDLGYYVTVDSVRCQDYGVAQDRGATVVFAALHTPLMIIEPMAAPAPCVSSAIGHMPHVDPGGSTPGDQLHFSPRLSAKVLRRAQASAAGDGLGSPNTFHRMSWGGLAPPIKSSCFKYGNGRFGHPDQDRQITLREAALLQGFPMDYAFVAPGRQLAPSAVGRMISRATPVPLAAAIARSISWAFDSASTMRIPGAVSTRGVSAYV